MRIPLNRNDDVPLYRQIAAFIRQQIETGRLLAPTRLPASRQLAGELGVSRLTVTNAYAELEAEGLVVREQGRGTFVAELPLWGMSGGRNRPVPQPHHWPEWQQSLVESPPTQPPNLTLPDHPDMIHLTHGIGAPHLFSADDFRKCLRTVLRRDGSDALGYGEPMGYGPLRATIAQILSTQGIPADGDDILITSGSQQAITLVARLLLRPGDAVVVESPTYEAGLDIFRASNVRLIGVPVDGEGLQMEPLETALRTHHPRLIYTIPTFHNPTGVSLSGQRRRQLLALAAHYNVPVLEDDFVGDLRYSGHAQPALKALDQRGDVIYVNTFSKVLVPGLRIGFLVASGPVLAQLTHLKATSDRASSGLIQRALQEYISVGRYQAHLRKVCRQFRQQREAMVGALRELEPAGCQFRVPDGGLFIWVRLPDGLTASQLLPTALAQGVAFSPGKAFYPHDPDDRYLRLNFTMSSPERIVAGIERLGLAIHQLTNQQMNQSTR